MTAGRALAFAARMAGRERRGAWRHFAAFFACVTLGVAAIVAVGTLAASLERTLAREAKALMGGDVELRSPRPLDTTADGELARLRERGATVVRVEELVGMARNPARGDTSLVELKAVERGYPLYGRLQTTPPSPLGALLDGRGAMVQADLLGRLGLHVGDPLAIGAATFTIRGIVDGEPDRSASLVSLGPRVVIAIEDLAATGLVRLGSRVRYRTLVRLSAPLRAGTVRDALAGRLHDPAVRVTAFDDAQPGLRRFFVEFGGYLGLVGLASLLVGGIGVATSVATFLRRQVTTIAVLKCLGAPSGLLVATYLVQTQAVGVAGSLAGALLGVTLQPVLMASLAPLVPFTLEAHLEPWVVVRGIAMGTLAALLCALWPLLGVRAVKPSLILRRDVDAAARRGPPPWAATLPIVAGIVALTLWQAGSLRLGGIFLGASAGALVVLVVLARGLVFAARHAPRPRSLAWRQGLANLQRPGGHTSRVVLALGSGVMLLVAVSLLQRNLAAHIDHEQRREAPSFFFVDVQPDQRDAFTRLVSGASGGTPPALTPVVRSRLSVIDGVRVTRDLVEGQRAAGGDGVWYYTREYVLTTAAEPPPGNVVRRGRWWSVAEAAERPRISLEEGAARHLGVDVGSRLTFDIQGVPVEAEVMSLRKVDWQSLSTNFFVIFSPGALDGAPLTYVATARVPAAAEPAVQNAVVAAFPNVTAIPVRDVLERVAGVLGDIAIAIRVVALFTVGTGLGVMAGALTATRYQRLYESLILRTLGASRGAVARAFAVEYACVGAVAGLGGTALAAILAWIVLRFVLDTPWTPDPGAMLLGLALATSMSLVVGFAATFRLLGQKPLAMLRQE
jgi:putative ABC transport system permease protein